MSPAATKNQQKPKTDSPSALFDSLLKTALTQNLRFLHIEPAENNTYVVRAKSTSHLSPIKTIKTEVALALFDHLRSAANVPPAKKSFPQDATFSHKGFNINFTSLPLINGEKVFLHLTDQSRMTHDLKTLGMTTEDLTKIQSIQSRPSGLVLVLGLGKTTTMFSLLNLFDPKTRNISTIESRPSFRLKHVNQFLNPHGDIKHLEQAFAAAVRQHSDIILLSQIDSPKLAELAVDAATNHRLIITSLPILDPYSAPDFLARLGAPDFLIAHTLRLIISQSLTPKTPTTKPASAASEPLAATFNTIKIDERFRELFLAGLSPAELRTKFAHK